MPDRGSAPRSPAGAMPPACRWHSPRATVKRPVQWHRKRVQACIGSTPLRLRMWPRSSPRWTQASARRTSSSTTPRRGFAGRSQISTPRRRETLSKSHVSAPSWSPSRRHGGCWRAARVASCSPAHLPGSRGSPIHRSLPWASLGCAALPRRSPASYIRRTSISAIS